TVGVAAGVPIRVSTSPTVGRGGESNPANDLAPEPPGTSLAPAPALFRTKTHAGNFTQGQTGASYALTVSNAGTAASSGTVTMTRSQERRVGTEWSGGTGWS